TARFLCGRTIPAQEGSRSRSATMESASNHNWYKESFTPSNRPICKAKDLGSASHSAKPSLKCMPALFVLAATDWGREQLLRSTCLFADQTTEQTKTYEPKNHRYTRCGPATAGQRPPIVVMGR